MSGLLTNCTVQVRQVQNIICQGTSWKNPIQQIQIAQAYYEWIKINMASSNSVTEKRSRKHLQRKKIIISEEYRVNKAVISWWECWTKDLEQNKCVGVSEREVEDLKNIMSNMRNKLHRNPTVIPWITLQGVVWWTSTFHHTLLRRTQMQKSKGPNKLAKLTTESLGLRLWLLPLSHKKCFDL